MLTIVVLVDVLISLLDGNGGSSQRGDTVASRGDSIASSSEGTSGGVASSTEGSSSSVASGGNRGSSEGWGTSSSISNLVNSLSYSDRDLLNCVNWGVNWGHNSLGRVGGVGGVVDMGSLNDLLDGVNLVGSSNMDSTGNSNIIGSGDVLVDNDLSGNRCGNMDGHINVVLLHIDLGDNVGGLGGDPGVSPHRSKDLLLDHGISRGRSQVDRCWGDGGSVRYRGNRDGRGGNGHGHHRVLGGAGLVGDSRLWDGLNTGN